jgi:hypothetical protein
MKWGMMIVAISESYDRVRWRELIGNLNGTPFHLPEVWAVGIGPDTLRYLVWEDGGALVAAALAIVEKRRVFHFLPGSSILHLPTAPVLQEGAGVPRHELYAHLRRSCAEQKFRGIAVDSRWGEAPDLAGRLEAPADYPLVEFLIDLARGEEALLQAMHKKHRKNLRLAQEAGLDVVEEATMEAFLSVRGMQQSSAERSAEKGNRYGIQDERFYRESFEAIYRNGPGRVLFARKGGQIVAALAYLEFGRKAVTVRSGSTSVGYETSAMYLLQFELIRRLAQRGFSELNIGGVPAEAAAEEHPQHGLFNYKRYYGGTPRACAGFTLNVKAGG